jgi:hypothetical protein
LSVRFWASECFTDERADKEVLMLPARDIYRFLKKIDSTGGVIIPFAWSIVSILVRDIPYSGLVDIMVLYYVIAKLDLVQRLLGLKQMWLRIVTTAVGATTGIVLAYSEAIHVWIWATYWPTSAAGIYIPTSGELALPSFVSALLDMALILIPLSLFLPAWYLVRKSDLEHIRGPASAVLLRFESHDRLRSELKKASLSEFRRGCMVAVGGLLSILGIFIGIVCAISLQSSFVLGVISFAWMFLGFTELRTFLSPKRIIKLLSRDVTPLMLAPLTEGGAVGLFSGFLVAISFFPLLVLSTELDFATMPGEYLALLAPIYAYVIAFLYRLARRLSAFATLTSRQTTPKSVSKLPFGDLYLYVLIMIGLVKPISDVHISGGLLQAFRSSPGSWLALRYSWILLVFLTSLSCLGLIGTYARKGYDTQASLGADRFRIPIAAVSSLAFVYWLNPFGIVFAICLPIAFWAIIRDVEVRNINR